MVLLKDIYIKRVIILENLIMTSEHSSEHHEVGAGSDGLGHVSGASAATILTIDESCRSIIESITR